MFGLSERILLSFPLIYGADVSPFALKKSVKPLQLEMKRLASVPDQVSAARIRLQDTSVASSVGQISLTAPALRDGTRLRHAHLSNPTNQQPDSVSISFNWLVMKIQEIDFVPG